MYWVIAAVVVFDAAWIGAIAYAFVKTRGRLKPEDFERAPGDW